MQPRGKLQPGLSTERWIVTSDLLLNCLQVALNPKNTVFDAKRLIGRRFDDAKIQDDMKHWPFTVISDGGKPKIQVEYKGELKKFAPEEVSSMVLTKMREIAEAYLGGEYLSIGSCHLAHRNKQYKGEFVPEEVNSMVLTKMRNT
uniref:Heat shock protein 70 n=1 Tax=Timema poppense TaxID=170557 RepID=A0A7R9D6U9_TIMPO|nr:unnamed protein product [Timema poppensis]